MGASRPKQYLPLAGRPVVWHTLSRLQSSPSITRIVLVVRAEDASLCTELGLDQDHFGKLGPPVPGGRERWQSVRAGLQQASADDHIIVVHDAVRPFVTHEVLERVIQSAHQHGAAIAAMPVTETVKEAEGRVVRRTPERSALWVAQTPQGFRREWLLEAHARAGAATAATDDSMLVERIGRPVQLVPGDRRNVKITTPEDLIWADHLLATEEGMTEPRLRVGQGYDVHALTHGRALVLGGVTIPFERGLAGHSDADVLTHAVIDALLGAAGCGDIGHLFPDSDARYAGISSLILLSRTGERLASRGVRIVNVDTVVAAQRPKLASYLPSMASALAQALKVPAARISVKATTTEGLGLVGREEGIAAQAVALVEC